jgi:cytochrome b involved in lipid metabolism
LLLTCFQERRKKENKEDRLTTKEYQLAKKRTKKLAALRPHQTPKKKKTKEPPKKKQKTEEAPTERRKKVKKPGSFKSKKRCVHFVRWLTSADIRDVKCDLSTGGNKIFVLFTSMATYTVEEVSTHNTEQSCWIIIDGEVFDVTGFLDTHPGGKKILLKVGGKDASKQFANFHDVKAVLTRFECQKRVY